MAIVPYLAMTAAEFRQNPCPSAPVAWMACHFSPYGTGLSNLPKTLPCGSLLILNDITPIHGHDRELIAAQLLERLEVLECSGLLLDFQRPGLEETAALTAHLVNNLPHPVAVSEVYGKGLGCPVFLPPIPPDIPAEAYLAPYKGREIWLELALSAEVITVTESGSKATPIPCPDVSQPVFSDNALHCHYAVRTDETSARFTLWRTKEDLKAILSEAESLGITGAVGLFQELHSMPIKHYPS